MGVLSSIFGSQPTQPVVGAQPLSVTEIPEQLKPYYTDILSKAQALYNKRTDEGYTPYEGPTIAPYSPEQEQAFTGIAGLQGGTAPKYAEAEQMTRDAASGITGAQIQEAMSPYQQAVTDIEKRESQKAFEQNVLPKIRAAQVAQGSFGGTRGTLLEAQTLGEQQQLLSDIQTKGSQAAFMDARTALDAERTRQGQASTNLANIAGAGFKTGLAELGAQQGVGEAKQQQTQAALDEAYRQFLQEKDEPYQAMQKYQQVVSGAPISTTTYAPPPPPQPSLGQQLIGGLAGVGSLYGTFTGKPIFGEGKTGGGIAGLVKRAVPGQIVPQDELETAIGDVRSAVKQRQEGLKDIEQTYGYLTSPAYLQSKVLGDISQKILSPEANQAGNLLGAAVNILPGVAKTAGDTQKEIASLKVKLKQAQGEGNLEGAKAILEALKSKEAILSSRATSKLNKAKLKASSLDLAKASSAAINDLKDFGISLTGARAIYTDGKITGIQKADGTAVEQSTLNKYALYDQLLSFKYQEGLDKFDNNQSKAIAYAKGSLSDAINLGDTTKKDAKKNVSSKYNVQTPDGVNINKVLEALNLDSPEVKKVTN